MPEAVASHIQFRAPSLAAHAPGVERLRERAEDLEQLVEKFIERHTRLERELRDVKEERDRLREENERLKGE